MKTTETTETTEMGKAVGSVRIEKETGRGEGSGPREGEIVVASLWRGVRAKVHVPIGTTAEELVDRAWGLTGPRALKLVRSVEGGRVTITLPWPSGLVLREGDMVCLQEDTPVPAVRRKWKDLALYARFAFRGILMQKVGHAMVRGVDPEGLVWTWLHKDQEVVPIAEPPEGPSPAHDACGGGDNGSGEG